MTREEARERLTILAGMVALEAPDRRAKYTARATVPWEIVEEIRQVMTVAGYDYRAARKRFEKERRQQIARRNDDPGPRELRNDLHAGGGLCRDKL